MFMKTIISVLVGFVAATALIIGAPAYAATILKGIKVVDNITTGSTIVTKYQDLDNNVVCYTVAAGSTPEGISCVAP